MNDEHAAEVMVEVKFTLKKRIVASDSDIVKQLPDSFPEMTGMLTIAIARPALKSVTYLALEKGDLQSSFLDAAFARDNERQAREDEAARVREEQDKRAEEIKAKVQELQEELRRIDEKRMPPPSLRVREVMTLPDVSEPESEPEPAPVRRSYNRGRKGSQHRRWMDMLSDFILTADEHEQLEAISLRRVVRKVSGRHFRKQVAKIVGNDRSDAIYRVWHGDGDSKRSKASPEKAQERKRDKSPEPKKKPEASESSSDDDDDSEYSDVPDEDEFQGYPGDCVDDEDDDEEDESSSPSIHHRDTSKPRRRKRPTFYSTETFKDAGREEVVNLVEHPGGQFDSLQKYFLAFLSKRKGLEWREDWETFLHHWKTNPFFQRAEALLMVAWQRGFEGPNQRTDLKRFYELLKTNFDRDAPETDFESGHLMGDGLCYACGGKKPLSCKFWPDVKDRGTFQTFGGHCGKHMEHVMGFMKWFRKMMAEIRVLNKETRIRSAYQMKYWRDLIHPLDQIQSFN
jgi:hypothetical protein